jgi:AraC family transcriptional regulator
MEFGRFFGKVAEKREMEGFTLARFTPTVPKREVQLHRHEEAHFVFVLRGVYETSAQPAHDGSAPRVIYSPPGTVHRDCFSYGDLAQLAFATLSVSTTALATVATETELPARGVCLPASAVNLVRQLLSEARGQDDLSGAVTEACCLELLQRTGIERELAVSGAPGWLRRARELLRDTCLDVGPKSIAEIAGELGIHPVHLARRFRQSFGMTPGEYSRRCRLERARRLMRRSAAPLAAIAAAAGFSDQSHFSNAFRKSFGVSPGADRQAQLTQRQARRTLSLSAKLDFLTRRQDLEIDR